MAHRPEPCLFTIFDGHRHLASGTLPTVALAGKHAAAEGAPGPILIFDNGTGRSIDVDTRGTDEQVRERLSRAPGACAPIAQEESGEEPAAAGEGAAPRGRGRPKLGVIAREVTLLPRHWEWLGSQPGGSSVALRKLVEEARRNHARRDEKRAAHERAYHFMSAMAGNLRDFEEATRALFADDASRFATLAADWPADIRSHAEWLAFGDTAQTNTPAAAGPRS
ncbi:DUF2239 family protein [Trinickia dinghuensis]|uniref:DUF2239 family protein n=1 Tax=Trinickia dinghuensis TaxID=2291023 RepID=A0A3D8JT13_9BURK|nr:DUF2239 family protein [Trinickia dinghuensis]RDU96010.1 DUF2239 family protein [Trinickia dinghuensis]